MKASSISSIISPVASYIPDPEADILLLLTDSRKLSASAGCLFFAIQTKRNSGVNYINQLYDKGVRNFVVPRGTRLQLDDANLWEVEDVVLALQQMAQYRRQRFDIPVIGITGSNGKTIIKDWLVQLLQSDYRLISNPKSYNSQIGVPLSVWPICDTTQMAIIEAGISQPGEMERLQSIIRPTIGILSNIGSAHDECFASRRQKTNEKLKLFEHCPVLIYSSNYPDIQQSILEMGDAAPERCLSWGSSVSDDVFISDIRQHGQSTTLSLSSRLLPQHSELSITIPFSDSASIEDAMHCITLLLYLGYPIEIISQRCAQLLPVEMRMEIKEGINHCLIINDSYSLDLNSLPIALDFLNQQQQYKKRTLIISDFVQSGLSPQTLSLEIVRLTSQYNISKLIIIGQQFLHCEPIFKGVNLNLYLTTDQFLSTLNPEFFRDEVILIKGARMFGFERIVSALQRHSHETIMEVNLSHLIHNLNYYRSLLKPSTKLMAMVKASSYGAGRVEVANALQFNNVDYLTVAYIDEGVDLRQNGITLPIMVMNPEPAGFDDIINYHLEPDIYSFEILELFASKIRQSRRYANIHIEIDTGMHRLGFSPADIPQLSHTLHDNSDIFHVQSIFSHLACADDPSDDSFTLHQLNSFCQSSLELSHQLNQNIPPLRHILNSSGIERFANFQLDMVRLGIGLYGISPNPHIQKQLRQVSRLVTRISQIKNIPVGDSVGYNRRWIAQHPSTIAIIPIGYADGINRHLGNSHGYISLHGELAPIIGNICMDMCFVDITNIPNASVGDEAILFGDSDLLQRNAQAAGTIPYEMLTSIAPRVKRIYLQED